MHVKCRAEGMHHRKKARNEGLRQAKASDDRDRASRPPDLSLYGARDDCPGSSSGHNALPCVLTVPALRAQDVVDHIEGTVELFIRGVEVR